MDYVKEFQGHKKIAGTCSMKLPLRADAPNANQTPTLSTGTTIATETDTAPKQEDAKEPQYDSEP